MPGLDFVPFEHDNVDHLAELKYQRVVCGWDFEDDTIDIWLRDCQKGEKFIWWLFAQAEQENSAKETMTEEKLNVKVAGKDQRAPPRPNPNFAPIGHIALDYQDYKRDETLASREKGRMTIATFFILGSQQGKGYGSMAMNKIEAIAAAKPHNAKTLTLTSTPAADSQNPEYWASFDLEYVEPVPTAEWYARRGFVPYKTEVRYQQMSKAGKLLDMECVFMEKHIR